MIYGADDKEWPSRCLSEPDNLGRQPFYNELREEAFRLGLTVGPSVGQLSVVESPPGGLNGIDLLPDVCVAQIDSK